jgi:hypothetical protein
VPERIDVRLRCYLWKQALDWFALIEQRSTKAK